MNSSVEHLGTTTIEELRAVLVGDVPFKTAVARIRKGSMSAKVPGSVALLFRRHGNRPTCLKIVQKPNWSESLPGIQLELRNEAWHVEPFLVRRGFVDEEDMVAVTVKSPWIATLIECVADEFEVSQNLLPFQNDGFAPVALDTYFEKQIRVFRIFGPERFFSKRNPVKKWFVCAAWDDWNRRGLDYKQRYAELEPWLVKHKYKLGNGGFENFCGRLKLDYEAPRSGKGGRKKQQRQGSAVS